MYWSCRLAATATPLIRSAPFKLIKAIEPKLVIPTHYADKSLKYPVPQQDLSRTLSRSWAWSPKKPSASSNLNPGELGDLTQLIILEKA
jgi:hypothetical protein